MVVAMEDHDIRHMRFVEGDFPQNPPDPLDTEMAIVNLESRVSRLEGELQILISLSVAQLSAVLAIAVALLTHAL
jgi:hypothetical protein